MINLFLIPYSEKSFVVTGDTIKHANALQKLGGRYNPSLKIGCGWIFCNQRKEIVEHYIKTGEIKFIKIEPTKKIESPKKNEKSELDLASIFFDLKNGFDEGEDYTGASVLEFISQIQDKYTT